jgi:3-deoxy-D-arabino-heptulosonate 7-phosphate (DAHP) synthase
MSPSHPSPVQLTDSITLGGDRLVVFAGPCSIESEDLTLSVAEDVKKMGEDLDIDVIFKASYDKANRTSVSGVSLRRPRRGHAHPGAREQRNRFANNHRCSRNSPDSHRC